MNIFTWLNAITACDTLYSNGNINWNDDYDKSVVIRSDEHWTIFEAYTSPVPSNCAVVLLDNPKDILKSMTRAKKSRVKLTFVLALSSNSSHDYDLHWLSLDYEVHIIQIRNNGIVKGIGKHAKKLLRTLQIVH